MKIATHELIVYNNNHPCLEISTFPLSHYSFSIIHQESFSKGDIINNFSYIKGKKIIFDCHIKCTSPNT